MNSILCIGEALIDMICTDKGAALSEGDHFLKKAGGAPMNVAAAIAALGGKVSVSAKVGNDPFGKHLIEVLNAFYVDTSHIISSADHFTTFAFVSLMENGERDFYFNRGADGMLNDAEVAAIDVNKFGIAHFGSATGFLPGPLQGAYANLLQRAKANGLFISFDPNYRQLLFGNNQPEFIKKSWEFIKTSDFVKVSDEEAMMITASSTVNEAMDVFFSETKAIIAVTIGKEGTLLGYRGKKLIVPSIEITPVDTTGAGDAFVGAVLYQLSQYKVGEMRELDETNWINIFNNANKAGARTCEYMGAMEAFKHLSGDIFKQ
jgi:fructokinase